MQELTHESSTPSVLYVIPGEECDSSMIFARRQFAALRERGLRMAAFYLRSRMSPTMIVRDWIRFRRELRRFRPQIVHPQFGTMTAFFAVLASPLPVVVTYRGSDLNPVPSIGRLRRWLGLLMSQLSALHARQIVCVSEELVGRLWWGRAKTTIIPSGIDTKQFLPMDRNRARAEIGWDGSQKIVLFNAGREPKVKRIDVARAAFDAVRAVCPAATLCVLDGSTPPDRLPLILNAADCLLVTSDYEGSPNIVKEALACNLPVVSVDVGDVAERLRGVSNSHIVPRDTTALAAAVVSVLDGSERSDGASKAASLSLAVTSAALEAVYRRALEQGAK